MMAMELNYSNSDNLTKTLTHWELDDSNKNDSIQVVAPEPLQPNKATLLMSTK